MPVACSFILNRRSMSTFLCPGFGSVAAFSGMEPYVDDPDATVVQKKGPLLKGTYYIIDRESGGRLGWLYDLASDLSNGTRRGEWFALYRSDATIDDWTCVEGVRRGNFRLHPSGRRGISEGCITLPDRKQFDKLRTFLKSQLTAKVPGANFDYYGTVTVR